MTARPTDVQIINDAAGLPAFTVIPYDEYRRLFEPAQAERKSDYVPQEVVDMFFDNQWSALRAWREYLGLTQAQVAARLGVSQAAYSQQENRKTLRPSSREKLARVLGITAEQLNF